MPIIDLEDKDGNKFTTIVCTRGKNSRIQYCGWCVKEGMRRPGAKLCDYVVSHPSRITHKRTCDLPMCDKHSRKIGEDRDVCPNHQLKYCGARDQQSGRVCDLSQDHLVQLMADQRHRDSTFPVDATERKGTNLAIEELKERGLWQ